MNLRVLRIINPYNTYSWDDISQQQAGPFVHQNKMIGISGGTGEQNGYPAQWTTSSGLLTGSQTYILDGTGTNFLAAAMYYDDKGRVVETRCTNHLGGYDIAYNQYNFTGQILKTLKKHKIASTDEVAELFAYMYDPALRLLNTTYTLNNQTPVILASNTYDGLGRLIIKHRHNGVDTDQYEYNIRNSPTKLKSGTFEENLYYNLNLPNGTDACFNGNIAYSTWTYNGVTKGYSYAYDDLNQLNSATFKQGTSSQGDNSFNENFTYDDMGNILTLQRKKDNVLIDDLTLHYSNGEKSNQLDWIDDSKVSLGLPTVKQYQNKSTATSGGEFAHDANGNMIKDLDRNIGAIQYNVLNLPDIIQFKNGNQIKNTYDASGRKLGTEYFTQLTNLSPLDDGQIISPSYIPGIVTQDGTAYIGNFEYNTLNGNAAQTTLSRIYNDEGYVENLASPNYYYYRKDHTGDNREVWCANTNTTVQRTQYYPSGLPWASNDGDNPGKQQRKYNGKEFIEMHGYDTYDIVWRQYYPAIARFQTPDPEIEDAYAESPYSMCDNNMVNRTDPNGRTWGDSFVGGIVGAVTNIIPGSTGLRNIYNPTEPSDYNNALRSSDAASLALGSGMVKTGGTAAAGGLAVAAAAGVATVATAGSGSLVTAPVAAGALTVAAAGTATALTGAVLQANSANNASKGYNYGNKEGNKTKSDNKLKPNSEATGDHSTFKRDGQGKITNTATYKQNTKNPSGFDEIKKVDVKGKSHNGVATPHVHEPKGQVRPANPNELPKQK